MKSITLLVGVLMVVGRISALSIELADWEAFKVLYGRTYEDEVSESMHRDVFVRNKKLIDEVNANKNSSFTLRVNHFTDKSESDMVAFKGFRLPEGNLEHVLRNTEAAEQFLQEIYNSDDPVPDHLDWREVSGRVSHVKNQLDCGACWAFASVGVLEGQQKVHTNNSEIVLLSEQNLVDCVKKDFGCGGGYPADAFDYVRDNGIDDAKSYPYINWVANCDYDDKKSVMSDGGHALLPLGDEETLKEVLAKYGPVAVAIDATEQFQAYEGGVFVDKSCKNDLDHLDHAVLAIGYGTDPKAGDYWLIKNSWGKHWGDQGYVKFARNRDNMCGITTLATVASF